MNADESVFEVRFEGESVRDAGIRARALKDELDRLGAATRIHIRKDDATNQDLGTTLVLVLGTPAVLAIARGLASYLGRSRGRISISKDGEVVAEGIASADAARIAEAMSKSKR